MTVGAALQADPIIVRAFAERLHAHVATAFAGIHQPGMMQLVSIHPASEATLSFPFDIGQVGYMVEEAIRQAETGHNVYVEARTVRKNARRGGKRGDLADTVGVFGLVNDADHDKGKGGHLNVEPSLVIETSPGNAHHWFLLDRPLPAEEARTLGAAIRAGAGADAASGVVTQPYRIPGTPNYPARPNSPAAGWRCRPASSASTERFGPPPSCRPRSRLGRSRRRAPIRGQPGPAARRATGSRILSQIPGSIARHGFTLPWRSPSPTA